jgi:hypothetical protein
MGQIVRGTKAKGGKEFTTGAILASEVNTDFNSIYNEFNGEIDEDNIDPAANIPNSSLVVIEPDHVNDHADTDPIYLTTASPGTTAAPLKPTDMEGELERIRYRFAANNTQINAQYMTSGDILADLGWVEPGAVGRNMLPNPGFEAQTGVADSAPDGWALVGTPGTVDILVPSATGAGLEKRSLNIIADDATEGISAVVGGLKLSTKYIVGIAYILNSGEMNLITAGGLNAGKDYQDILFNDATAAGTLEEWQGVVSTNTSADDLTVTIQSTAAADDFELFYVWMYELSDTFPVEIPHIPQQYVTYTTNEAITDTGGTGTWTELTDLTIDQYIPHAGYKCTYEVTISCVSGTGAGGSTPAYAFRIEEGQDGGADVPKRGPFPFGGVWGASEAVASTFTLKYVVENPTPGVIYDFSVDVYVDGNGATYPTTIGMNPDVGAVASPAITTQSEATLTIERL